MTGNKEIFLNSLGRRAFCQGLAHLKHNLSVQAGNEQQGYGHCYLVFDPAKKIIMSSATKCKTNTLKRDNIRAITVSKEKVP